MFHTSKKRTVKKSHRARRRGQFTIFVILGLLVFMIFTFAVYARIKIASAVMTTQADVQLKNYLTNNALNQYVSNCLDAVTYDIFIKASMQGGLFNISDKINNTDYYEYYSPEYNRTFYVPVLIDANYDCPDPSITTNDFIVSQIPGPYPINPNYPNQFVNNWPSIYLSDTGTMRNRCIRDSFRTYSGFFGVNNLSILCDNYGANAPNPLVHPGPSTCEYYTSYKKSLQKLLEEQITNDISNCVNFTEILNRIPSNITNVGTVNTTVQFNQGGFNVKLEYPFTILMRNRQPMTRLIDFGVTKDIPFKELYDYTFEMANYDVKNVTFELIRDGNTVISKGSHRGVNLYNPFYLLNITEGNESNGFSKLVQVIDTSHKIHGIPLMINFYIRNRAPVLDYIHNGLSEKYDLVAVENRTITISPQGYDPDDEHLTNYTYGGWLEDQTDYFNTEDPYCIPPLNTIDYILANCTKKNDTGNPEHNWTKSYPYLTTGQNASYIATALDLGLHFVTVTVTDSYGLYDFQTVRILVFDLPVAIVNGSNFYDDVDKDRASYEDLYLLNGAESTVGTVGQSMGAIINTFTWDDPYEPFNIPKIYNKDIISTKQLAIPNETNTTSLPTIMTIKDYTFGERADDYTIHNITLTVTTNIPLSDSEVFQVNVTKCLNHSSDIPSYPYNTYPDDLGDALNADHTCCTDAMTYADQSTPCYSKEQYGIANGVNNNFIDYGIRQPSPPTVIVPSFTPSDDPSDNIDNDVLKQNFTRYCSGDRGNTCTGDASNDLIVVDVCKDTNTYTGTSPNPDVDFNVERCTGPNTQYFNGQATDTDLGCEDYYHSTFEGLSSGGTGHCTGNNPQFSADTITWESNSKFKCDGMCSNGACVPFGCACDATYSTGQYDYYCNGLTYPGDGQPLPPNKKSCYMSPRYFEDNCISCGLTDSNNNICRSGEYGDGCDADPGCNNKPIGTISFNEEYCTPTCQLINCSITPYRFNIASGNCFNSCSSSGQCNIAGGYLYCCIAASGASGCIVGGNFIANGTCYK